MRSFRWLFFWPVIMAYSDNAALMGDDTSDAARAVFHLGCSFTRGCFGFSNASDILAVADYRNGTVQLHGLQNLSCEAN